MMSEESKKNFLKVLKNNTKHPIIVEGLEPRIISGAVIIPASITPFDLGSLSSDKPAWVSKLEKIKSLRKFLIIDGIDTLDDENQEKFVWLLENRQDNGYKLEESVQVLLSIKNDNLERVNQKIKSLCINWKI